MGRKKESPRQHEKVKVRRAQDHQSQKKKKKRERENLNVREWPTESTAVEGQEW